MPLSLLGSDGRDVPVREVSGAAATRDTMSNTWKNGTVAAAAILVDMQGAPNPAKVWVRPGPSCTIRVSSCSEFDWATNPAVNWTVWPNGDVTGYSEFLVQNVAALRIERVAGATDSVWGVL